MSRAGTGRIGGVHGKKAPEVDEERCPKCGGGMVQVIYGMPDTELMEAAERGEVVLGGCSLPVPGEPLRSCPCGHLSDSRAITDNEYDPVPDGLVLALPGLYALQAAVGPDRSFGVVVIGEQVVGLSADDNPDEWDVAYAVEGDPPWQVLFRSELSGDVLEWAAGEADAAHKSSRPPAGTVVVNVANARSIEAVIVEETGYRLVREEFDSPTHVIEQDRFESIESALHNAILQSGL
jgi:hypothetical protein